MYSLWLWSHNDNDTTVFSWGSVGETFRLVTHHKLPAAFLPFFLIISALQSHVMSTPAIHPPNADTLTQTHTHPHIQGQQCTHTTKHWGHPWLVSLLVWFGCSQGRAVCNYCKVEDSPVLRPTNSNKSPWKTTTLFIVSVCVLVHPSAANTTESPKASNVVPRSHHVYKTSPSE